jgi:hypothetical protein
VCETNYTIDFKRLFLRGFFEQSLEPDIRGVLRGRTPINTGLLIGPSAPLQRCLSEAFCMIQDRSKWGPDMVALNYILHRDGFVPIEETYNCVITTARSGFRIRQGRFYFPDGSLIKIVHNAGNKSFFRIIGRFGLGEDRNRIRRVRHILLRSFGKVCRISRSLQDVLANDR